MLRHILKVLPLLLILVAVGAQAIIIRHDRRDSGYQEASGRFPQVFWLHERFGNRLCLATLVDSEWALTAAHCLQETPLGESMTAGEPWPVAIGKSSNAVDRVVVHPDYDGSTSREAMGTDLAMLHLGQAVGSRPLSLYEGADELGAELFIMGWGFTGTGDRDTRHNDHRFRLAANTVTQAGHWLEFIFDDPRESTTVSDLEGMPGLGDSGGPAVILRDGGFVLVGVARGELQNGDPRSQGLYGAVAVYERVSLHVQWIRAVIGNGKAGSE